MTIKKKILSLIVLVLFCQIAVFSQDKKRTNLISGKVFERQSNEALVGATVRLVTSNEFTSCDESGAYRIFTGKRTNQIIASYAGYKADTIVIYTERDTSLNFYLEPMSLGELIIKAPKKNISDHLNSTSLSLQQIKNIPSLLGEPDVLRALTMLPGVSNGTEGSVGLNVRGGSPDQNLILIDGAAVYNASHLFGFLSTFNADAVKRVELLKGSFPARYGGRLSSVIDITFKDGNKEKANAEVGIGLIASKFFLESPIQKKRSSFMIAARSSYLDLFNLDNKKQFYKSTGKRFFNYNLYDINAKANFLIGKKGSLTFGAFLSNDVFFLAEKPKDQVISENTIAWNNKIFNIRYLHPLTSQLSFNAQVTFNRYEYLFKYSSEKRDTTQVEESIKIENKSKIYDIGYKNNFDWIINRANNLSFGLEYYNQNFLPNLTQASIDGIKIERDIDFSSKLRQSQSAALYMDWNWKINPFLGTSIGLRQANYQVDKVLFSYLEPRISVNFDMNQTNALKLNMSIMNQPIHLLSNNTLGLTNDAWVPATSLTPPENAIQYSLSYGRELKNIDTYLSIETFYKKMTNLIDYTEGANPVIGNASKGYEQVVQKNGTGRAYGIEFLLHKEVGKMSGIVEYTLSKSERLFSNINNGRWYNSRFDRTHDFGATLTYQINKKWQASTTFMFSTGAPFSGPSYFYILPTNSNQTSNNPVFIFYEGKNNLRLPNYHRLDVGITYTKVTKRKRSMQLSFGAYNVYNRYNKIAGESAVFIQPDSINSVTFYRNLIPILPYFSYTFKFKKHE